VNSNPIRTPSSSSGHATKASGVVPARCHHASAERPSARRWTYASCSAGIRNTRRSHHAERPSASDWFESPCAVRRRTSNLRKELPCSSSLLVFARNSSISTVVQVKRGLPTRKKSPTDDRVARPRASAHRGDPRPTIGEYCGVDYPKQRSVLSRTDFQKVPSNNGEFRQSTSDV
jgi:hypothetical protein